MSAIAAIVQRNGRPVPREDIERMTRAIAVYGPEFQRSVLLGEAAFGCALGFYTPEDVRKPQPVSGAGGRYSLLFDGRIDNREEIGAALGLSAGRLSEFSDAELAMRSIEKWGTASFLKWIAEFALLLWDGTERRLTLARDPFGQRSLVYYDGPDRFVAATMPRGLHALPDIPRELDHQKIADALCQLLTDTTRTFFKGLSICPAGHIMTVTRDTVRSERYYALRDHVRDIRHRRDEDYVEEARELFQTAVDARLRSSGPVGAFMSGGLDSSTGAAFAAQTLAARGKRLPVFTWVPEAGWDGRTEAHCYGDETPYVEAIAARIPNIDLTLVDAAGRSHYHRQDEYLRLSDMPVRNAGISYLTHSILEEAKARNIRVMLTGESGNMTLSYRGDGLYYELFRSGKLARLARELRFLDPKPRAMARNFYQYVASGILSDRAWETLQRLRGRAGGDEQWLRFSAVVPEFGRQMQTPERGRQTGFDFFTKPSHAKRQFWYWTVERLFGGVAQWGPAMQALYGIETRDPFADRRLVEWCFGVPENQYRRNGVGRWLVKRMMNGVLPDEILRKPREVGRVGCDWRLRMTRDLDQMKTDLARMGEDGELGRMIDVPRLLALLDDWPQETVVDPQDDRRFYLQVNLPMAMQVGRFMQLVKGTNA